MSAVNLNLYIYMRASLPFYFLSFTLSLSVWCLLRFCSRQAHGSKVQIDKIDEKKEKKKNGSNNNHEDDVDENWK